jgi:glutathione-S-conjugate glycine hydrolase
MLKWSSTARVMAIGLCLLGTPAAADTLPLPQNLIDFTSEQGEHLLLNAEAKAAYWPLAAQFVTQEHQAYCGVASLVMVMNALRIPAPTTPEFTPYSAFTQGDFLNDATEKILPRAVLAKQGMTLDQIARLAETYPVRAEIHHASDTDLDEFRTMAISHLQQKDHFILVNYLRRAIGEERGGHISPLAAYDADADRFLILDVSRYKYPPVWVTASDLFDAMNTADSDNDNRTRGYVFITPGPP